MARSGPAEQSGSDQPGLSEPGLLRQSEAAAGRFRIRAACAGRARVRRRPSPRDELFLSATRRRPLDPLRSRRGWQRRSRRHDHLRRRRRRMVGRPLAGGFEARRV